MRRRVLYGLMMWWVGQSILGGCTIGVPPAGGEADLGEQAQEVDLTPPTLLSATALTPNFETITWSAVTGSTVDHYIVDTGTSPDSVGTLTSVPSTTTSWTQGNLLANTQYCWDVRAVAASVVSVPSNVLCAVTPAVSTTQPPQDVHATAISDSRITLSWDAVSGATVYHILARVGSAASFTPFFALGPTQLSVVFANLPAGTEYSFEVTAVTSTGESIPSTMASATTFPAGLEGYWQFDERTGTVSADASGYGRDATLTSASFSTDRPPFNLLGNKSALSISTDPSSQAAVAVQPALRFPGDVPFALAAWVKLAAAVDTDIVGMRVASCGTLGWKLGQDATNGLNLSGGGGTLSFGSSLPAGVWTHVAFSYDSTTSQLTRYLNGQAVGTSSYGAKDGLAGVPVTIGHVGGCAGGGVLVDELRMYSRTLSAAEIAAFGAVPPAPTLTVTASGARTELLSWTAVAGATRYFIYRGTSAGKEAFLTSVASSALSFTAQQLSSLTQYAWYVRAEVGGLDSPASNEVLVSTLDILAAPAGVSATVQPPSSAQISWGAVTGATAYEVFQSTGGGSFVLAQTLDASTTSAVISNLAPGTTYAFEVAALDTTQSLGHLSTATSVTLP